MKVAKVWLVIAALGLVMACGGQEEKPLAQSATPVPPIARMEIRQFPSITLTDQEFLTGRKDGKPVTLAGELRLPRPGTDRLPAVIILHGSGGISANAMDWEQDLNAMGVATFVLDCFTGRGIVNTNYDQGQFGRLAMIVDVY